VLPPPEEESLAPRLRALPPVPPRDGPAIRASRPGRDVRLPSLSAVSGGRERRG